MEIKIDCKLLNEQIEFLNLYSSFITDEYKKGLIEGIAELLSQICYAVEDDRYISFKRVD